MGVQSNEPQAPGAEINDINKRSENTQLLIFGFMFLMLIVIGAGALIMFGLNSAFNSAFGVSKEGVLPSNTILMQCLPLVIFAAILIFSLLRVLAAKGVDIKADKNTYALGEAITGTVTITKNMSKQARSLKVYFYGLERHGKHVSRVCASEITISGPRTFGKGEIIPFSISMPASVSGYLFPKQENIPLFIGFGSSHHIRAWQVEVKLDMPGAIDIAKSYSFKIVPESEKRQEGGVLPVT